MPESVGKTLKKIRESKHLSIEEVSERTRTPKKILSAIEENNLHQISSAFYAKGFIKSYSQFLGALEEKVIREYLSGAQKKDEPLPIPEVGKASGNVLGDWFQKNKKHVGLGVLVIFCIWALFFGFVQLKKVVKSKKVASELTLPTRDLNRVGPVSTDSEEKETLELEIIARYNTWIQVTSSEKLLFKGILEKGAKDIWQAKKDIELELGNAGGVKLKLNGKDLGSPGRRGEKKSIVVTKDGIKE